jgi:histidinol phosphatase-like enzyme|tara:strand:+ start:20693 stop:21100 length:408 start_codon:yes stop_codon:yes gene_type:complete
MEQNKFLEMVKSTEKSVIALDFDGVIHDHYKGYGDGTIYGDPIEGSLESIKELYELGYTLKIYSCKSCSDRPLVNNKTGSELIRGWLEKHKVSEYVKEICTEKPNALAYIDDKGVRFTTWNQAIKDLRKFKIIGE